MLGLDEIPSSVNGSVFKRALMMYSAPLPSVSIKACTCCTGSCPSHMTLQAAEDGRGKEWPARSGPTRPRSRPLSSATGRHRSKPEVEVRAAERDELKLSLASLASPRRRATSAGREPKIGDGVPFDKWLQEKMESRRQAEAERKVIEEEVERERQRKLDMERKNFDNWLAAKRFEERRRRQQQIDEERERDRAELERARKKIENDLSFQLWCKRKEEQELEKKLKDQVDRIRTEEEKKRRAARNTNAYERWLKESRDKPRPLPLNRGLESLRSCASVSYVNPQPWQPNLEKPTTQ